jgi:signal transduction histidine kinase
MTSEASERLRRNIEKIMSQWQERAEQEVFAALHQKELALRNSLPEYLLQLAGTLSTSIERTDARIKWDQQESERVGRKHGRERAGSRNYTIDQLIFEYHILRQVIWDVLGEESPLSAIELEIITGSIEQAVNDAATEFSDTLRNIQEKLMATLAHDLRSPLTSASLDATILARRPDDRAYVLKAANRISHNMSRLDAMIQNLLDVARLQAGEGIPLPLEQCDLAEIAGQVADEFNDLSEKRFVCSSTGPVMGYWNDDGLRRVIENLATNAEKYGAPDTPITIEVHQTSDTASLTVHNLGHPIPAEDQGIIFQQYRRTRSAQEQAGWGVGLTIVKGITETFQGTVRVQSSAASGTSFIIELPKNRNMEVPDAQFEQKQPLVTRLEPEANPPRPR